jgi:predicted transcriptional regulator
MTKEVVACRPKEDLTRVEQLMAQHHKSRVLVIDENNLLVGVISLSDIAERDGAHAAQTMKQVSERETRTH